MTTLGIFTVKRVCHRQGEYFTYGGFGEYLASIRGYFDKTVLFARVFDAEPPEGFYQIPSGELEVIHLPAHNNEAQNLLSLPVAVVRSWKHVKRLDIIHARMPDYTGIIGAVLGKLRGVPVFCQVIADWHIEGRKTPITRKGGLGLLLKLDYYLYDYLERRVCRNKLVFAQGQSSYDKHVRTSNCHLVLSSSHGESDVVTPSDRFQDTSSRILTVARLTGVKNLQLVIQAFAAISAEETSGDWCLDIVGMGPKREALEALANKLGVAKNVSFYGQVNRGQRLWDLYDRADVFVLPSRSEGTPKVLLEAMARGLPVVASDVGGISTTVGHNERGLLFNDNDVADLVVQIRKMATDGKLRRQLVMAASEFSRLHSVEASTRRMICEVQAVWPEIDIESA